MSFGTACIDIPPHRVHKTLHAAGALCLELSWVQLCYGHGVVTGGLAGRKQRDSVAVAQSVLDHVLSHGPLPFELRVLEALLDGTTRHFQACSRMRALQP